jgi:three-Cys-motif partner protein
VGDSVYAGREQTLIKHVILRKYLERFAQIVGSYRDVLTYVDCFAGPWKVVSDDLQDSSFAIALTELRKARDTKQKRGRTLRLRCFFLEQDKEAFDQHEAFGKSITDAEVATHNAALEDSVSEILRFIEKSGATAFPFIFIDPTGWTGFALDTIRPLLRLEPGEVLINFMTEHIRRFLEAPDEGTQESLRRLFGSDAFRLRIQGLAHQDREDAAVEEYAKQVKEVGRFSYVCSAIVLHPESDRTHFHLIYATRSRTGVEVFKDAEKSAMAVQERARAEAKQRARENRTGQASLLTSEELHDPSFYNSLRERYLAKSRALVLRSLQDRRRVLYDDVWALAMSKPLTWESDLKEWIGDWSPSVHVEGMKPRQRVPHLGESNYLVWTADRSPVAPPNGPS